VGAAAAVQLPENLGLSALRFVKPTLAEIEALVEGEFKGWVRRGGGVGGATPRTAPQRC
jgi:hypothetical protein